jgi:hypothetical protein
MHAMLSPLRAFQSPARLCTSPPNARSQLHTSEVSAPTDTAQPSRPTFLATSYPALHWPAAAHSHLPLPHCQHLSSPPPARDCLLHPALHRIASSCSHASPTVPRPLLHPSLCQISKSSSKVAFQLKFRHPNQQQVQQTP